MDLNPSDDTSTGVSLRLQLEELDSFQHSRTEDRPSDLSVAIDLYRDDVETRLQELRIDTDASARPSGQPNLVPGLSGMLQSLSYGELLRFEAENLPRLLRSLRMTATQLRADVDRPATDQAPNSTSCVSCTDDINVDAIPVSCGHRYCLGCLQRLFELATSDVSQFPPQCCGQAITLDSKTRTALGPEIINRYLEKKLESETPNRTYCHEPQCQTFIPPAAGNDEQLGVATCSVCHRKTCTRCKKPAHGNSACPTDRADEQVLTIAQEEHWQRCPSCRRIIERNQGCNEISKW
ncbi:ibr finger domain containing protein [Grosmannia clavigera kw1407]|uniref:RBR-type E3 ubiquitin transferase n=1 Tax=Grosmannia clavigera (strain kw1407 / UAMH 11150) TaxID=655863 RepID=F0XTG6_GROCL|nr:ibr finger domain containing protein [Grosmannia clavigera kw1407]EFW98492.1 ibr finger domain containing protein [Grosmannia clavigera kw1407]